MVKIHKALHIEHRRPAFQAHQDGRDFFGLEVEFTRLVGRDLPTRHAGARHPVEVDGFEGQEAHLHRAVHRGAGGGQNAHHSKRLVGMFVGMPLAMVMTVVVHAVAQGDALAQAITHLARDFGPDHGLVQTIQRVGKRFATLQNQRLFVTIRKVLKKCRRGAQHRKAPVRIAQAQGHHPRHRTVLGHRPHTVHAHALRHAANVKDRKQHQLHRTAARAHNQINAADRL